VSTQDRHLSDTFYRSRIEGGDFQRPLCHRGLWRFAGIGARGLTTDLSKVTCPKCLARLAGVSLTQPAAAVAVAAVARRAARPTRTVIAAEVAEHHGVLLADLRSPSLKHKHARPRQEAMTLMMAAGYSSTQAGGYFGRDHSTALHARRQVEARNAALFPGDKAPSEAAVSGSASAKQARMSA
jgi:hypothetical protein